MESVILSTIKVMLGGPDLGESFDTDLLVHINSSVQTLLDLGVVPKSEFTSVSKTTKWGEFLNTDVVLDFVKSFVYLKTKMVFDPPPSSYVSDALSRQLAELEFRIRLRSEPAPAVVEEIQDEL